MNKRLVCFRFFLLVLMFVFLVSCNSSIAQDLTIPKTTWYKPAPNTTWQWQLQGVINTSYNVDLYDIDLFDTEVFVIKQLQNEGRKVICYFSAGSYEAWRDDAAQFANSDLGETLSGFEDERWLDIRSKTVKNIMLQRLEL